MATRSTLDFLRTETGSGVLLALVAALAVAWANSPWAGGYAAFVGQAVPVALGPFSETLSLGEWVRTGLMPVFFFVVGLQIKHEILRGELANPRRLALPLLAALGGVAGPAAVYLAVNASGGGDLRGWPTPAATDIGFALAALSLAGGRLPPTLRVFLLTLAMVTNLVSVVLIALLFSQELRPWMLAGAVAALAVLIAMSRWRSAPYVFWAMGFLLLWGFTLKAGIDTALAGAAAAFCAPLEPKRPGGQGVLTEMKEALHPYVAFFVLPLFALTAAGFTFRGAEPEVLSPVSLGVAAGLFLGKQAGVFGAALLIISLKWARRPTGAKWLELYGVAVLCGVGFTLSLYVGESAFAGADLLAQAQVRAGVILGSLASALVGMAVLAASQARRGPPAADET